MVFALLAYAAVCSAELEDYTPIDTRMCWGIAELDGSRFVTDCAGAEVLRLDSNGAILARMSTALNEQPSAPRGLCAVGGSLAYADGASGTIVFVDPQDMRIVRSVQAPGPNPQGLAFDGQFLWCADDDRDCLYRLDAKSAKVLAEVAAPSYTPRGMTWSADTLWVLDSWDLCAYRVDPSTGAVEASVYLPPGRPRALLASAGRLLVTLADKNALVDLPYVEGPGYILSLPVEAHVTATCTVRPRGDEKAPGGARLLVAIPPTTIRQSVENLTPFPNGCSPETDDFGQSVFVWDVPALDRGRSFSCGWEADVRVWAIRYHPRPCIASEANGAIDSAYLRGDQYVTMDAPAVRALADGLTGLEPLRCLLALRDRIFERMSYKLDGTWDPADVCLERGTGSCSEYTCIFAGAARGMGIPVRFAGATMLRPPQDPNQPSLERLDTVWHRWQEAHVEGYGWLPIDSTRDDYAQGPPFRRRDFLAVGPGVLVCSRGPLGEGTALGVDYRRRLVQPEGQKNAWRIDAAALWRLQALTPWT